MIVSQTRSVLLADDDADDCLLFEEALAEIGLPTKLIMVHDGEQLLQQLTAVPTDLPDILFLDLNMPRKNGVECLAEIKHDERLKRLAVVIITTSFQPEVADDLYRDGAQYYIRKPSDFQELKKLIHKALISKDELPLDGKGNFIQPDKKYFVLT